MIKYIWIYPLEDIAHGIIPKYIRILEPHIFLFLFIQSCLVHLKSKALYINAYPTNQLCFDIWYFCRSHHFQHSSSHPLHLANVYLKSKTFIYHKPLQNYWSLIFCCYNKSLYAKAPVPLNVCILAECPTRYRPKLGTLWIQHKQNVRSIDLLQCLDTWWFWGAYIMMVITKGVPYLERLPVEVCEHSDSTFHRLQVYNIILNNTWMMENWFSWKVTYWIQMLDILVNHHKIRV